MERAKAEREWPLTVIPNPKAKLLDQVREVIRDWAKRPVRLPVVLTKSEVQRLLSAMQGTFLLMAARTGHRVSSLGFVPFAPFRLFGATWWPWLRSIF